MKASPVKHLSTALVSLSLTCSALATPFSAEPVVILDDGSPAVGFLSSALIARKVPHTVMPATRALASAPNSRAVWVSLSAAQSRAGDVQAIVTHLRTGGGLLVLGEMPFQDLLYPVGDRWLPESAYLETVLKPRPILDFASTPGQRFTRSTSAPDVPSRLDIEPATIPTADGPARRSIAHATIPRLTSWTTFGLSLKPECPSDAATSFWARGTEQTRQLAVEWDETDGSRWIAKVDLTPDWHYYVLKPEDFRFFYDCPAKTRGGAGDRLHTDRIAFFSAGLAFTHTALGAGPHEFWLGDICLSQPKPGQLEAVTPVPPIDGLFPASMGYPIRPVKLEVNEAYRSQLRHKLPIPSTAWSAYWRPMGSGFDKDRRLRFIPVVTALNADGTRAGTLAQITLQFKGAYAGAAYGSVSIPDTSLLFSKPWMDLVAEMLDRMQHRAFFQEAGSSAFTYDIRDLPNGAFNVGLRTVEMDMPQRTEALLRVKDYMLRVWSGGCTNEGNGRLELRQPIRFCGNPRETRQLRAELRSGGRLVDVIEQEIGFDGPRTRPVFLQAREHNFYLGRRPFRAFGVNYMPSSGCASINGEEFEYYLEDSAYDPEIVEADLTRIEGLGMNAISIFIYSRSAKSANLPDILRRARKHHLMVNLGLRPAVDAPLAPRKDVFEAIIPRFRLAEKTEIMAYDIAWEPWWGGQGARARFGARWREWVLRKYGSIEAATRTWDYTPSQIDAFPLDEQLDKDGPWLKAVNDYRDFVDEILNASYRTAREQIRQLDPHHLVSFRQSEGANPFVNPGAYPMDLASVRHAVDFFSPEGYGVGEHPQGSDSMLFAAAYAHGLAWGKPILWAEYGLSVWSGSAFAPSPARLEKQAAVYHNILDGAQRSRAAGTFAWWFAGGYRTGEDSDYGIFNPDGTDRPVTRLLRQSAAQAKAPTPPVTWAPVITAYRTDSARGYAGVYERTREAFFGAVTKTNLPLIRSIKE